MNSLKHCIKCSKPLNGNEIAMHKKLIGRYSTEFLCTDCMAKHFNVEKKVIEDKIEYFIKTGCTLFPENQV